MRWSIALPSPSLVAQPWRESLTPHTHEKAVVLHLGPDAQGRKASVAIQQGPPGLEIAVLAEGRAGVKRTAFPEWFLREHIVVLLNPGHDHATKWAFGIDDAGGVNASARFDLPGEEPGDGPSREIKDAPVGLGEFQRLGDGRYWAKLFVAASQLNSQPGVPLGLALKAGFSEEYVVEPLVWPPMPAWCADQPMAFGDLHPATPSVQVDEIVFHEPAWGGEPSTVLIKASRAADAPREGRIEIETVLPEDSESRQPHAAWKASGERFEVRVPVVFSHRAKWANNLLLIARLRLRICDDHGKALWSAEYPFGFDAGVIVREHFGPQGKALPPRPEPGDPAFVERFRAYVLARIPAYRPRTTRDGAPSDFFLADPDGEADLDLAAPDSLDRVAAFLAGRFPDWQDALCAAAMWIYHPRVTRHSSTWSKLSSQSTLDTIPRLNGCFCGDTSRLGASLADKIGKLKGVALKGWSMGLRGHLTTLVESPIGRVVIDGMMGHWYHALDNTRLATLEEMRTIDQVARRMWYSPKAHGHEFFFGVETQIVRRYRPGVLSYPFDAP